MEADSLMQSSTFSSTTGPNCSDGLQAALWLSECWYPTQRQQKRLDSWAARIFGQVAGVRFSTDDDVSTFWRRLYRTGHEMLRLHGGSLNSRRKRRLHSFAGHLARVQSGVVHDALRTRSLAWWRYFQQRRLTVHPHRFHVGDGNRS